MEDFGILLLKMVKDLGQLKDQINSYNKILIKFKKLDILLLFLILN